MHNSNGEASIGDREPSTMNSFATPTKPPRVPGGRNNNNNNNNNAHNASGFSSNTTTSRYQQQQQQYNPYVANMPETPYTPYSEIDSSPSLAYVSPTHASGVVNDTGAGAVNRRRRTSSLVSLPGDRNLPLTTGIVVMVTVALFVAVMVCRFRFDAPPPAAEERADLSNPTGWVAVVAAILIFGSYGILIKAPQVQNAGVDTLVFQVYYSAGVGATSLLVLAYVPFVFSWWGVVGAGIWVASQLFAYVAIYGLGYAVALSLWAGLTMVVSFLWGSVMFDEHVKSYAGCGLGLFCLVSGIIGVAACETEVPDMVRLWIETGRFSLPDSALIGSRKNSHNNPAAAPVGGGGGTGGGGGGSSGAARHHYERGYGLLDTPMTDTDFSDSEFGDLPMEEEIPHIPRTVGFVCAVMVGLLNGSLMVPLHYFRKDHPNVETMAYLTSLALGIFMVTPVCFMCYCVHHWFHSMSVNIHFRVAAVPGLITGFFWSVGNAASIIATAYLGDTLGYPLTQAAIGVAGAWGIVYYREIQGSYAIAMFAVSVIVVVGGAALLALYT